jgi:uncharacterized protein
MEDIRSNMKYNFNNELVHESSPYLHQHAHNPVMWHPWSEKAFKLAEEENKLLLISIGYAACHWCHVMEHECFEDISVASFMNGNFICIKVDREEHPEVDQIYMNAVQLISGNGGWPLNAIALPDGKPIYAVTYLPKENWIKFLEYFVEMYQSDPLKITKQAEDITQKISQNEIPIFSDVNKFSKSTLATVFNLIDDKIDYDKGGNKGNIKFPIPNVYKYLLRNYFHTNNKKTLEAVKITLDKMFQGGIYDHIGGGFSRYSTDENWILPHFEKMLYDNAQLISLYSEAYQITHDDSYKQIVYQCIDFIKRELTDDNGGFYSSIDADSNGKEGEFYLWSYDELSTILGEREFNLFGKIYKISSKGNFEGKNIITLSNSIDVLSNKLGLLQNEIWEKIKEWNDILLIERNKRIHPRLDNKIIASWNALVILGLVDAYNVFGEESFLNLALKNAEYLKSTLIQDNYRILRIKKSNINGFLDDYSFTIEAFISLYQTTFDENFLFESLHLSEYVQKHFNDNKSELFFYSSDLDKSLITRKIDIEDNVIPSSNSSFAKSLFVLGKYFDNKKFVEKAKQMLSNVYSQIMINPYYFSNWCMVNINFTFIPFEIAIVGNNGINIKKELKKKFLPNTLLLGSTANNDKIPLLKSKYNKDTTTIYVCQDGVCQLPVTHLEDALKQIEE